MVIVFNGRELAQEKEKELQKRVKKLGITPKLVSVMIGNNEASHLYLSLKEKAAQKVGIFFEKKIFPADVDEKEVYQYLKKVNQDKKVQGIIIQMPVPKKFDPFWLVNKIDPEKDIDCLTPENLGLLFLGKPVFLPAVVKAILLVLRGVKLKGKEVVIVGAGDLVGKPLAIHLKNLGATVTLCDEDTKNLSQWTKKGEILVSATGVKGLIKKKMVKPGAIVIDVGNSQPEVEKEVREIASLVTPVPGGIGPLTIICLLENLLETMIGAV